jgi:HK97 family phage portal protein
VTEQTALNYAPFWAAVSLIAGDVASLPLILYKRRPDGGKERLVANPLYRMLHDAPNPEMTSMSFRETMQAHVLTWGNAYAEIERDGQGRPFALWPLVPSTVSVLRDAGTIRYRVTNPDGRQIVFERDDIFHLPGLSHDGVCGYSVVGKARDSLGLGMAAERFGGTFFGGGSSFGGVLTHPLSLSPQAKQNIRESIEAYHQGVDKAHRFLVMSEGMTYERLGIPPNDAQFLETRKFQVGDIARWFNVPPHKIGDLERATFSNIEHLDIEYYKSCLRKWLVRWEQEILRKLIFPSERRVQFAEHLVDGLLRGDIQSRYAAYAVGRQWGWLSADDIRAWENLNPLPDGQGQMYLAPQNMVPANRFDELIDAQVAPKTTAAAPSAPNGADDDTEEDPAERMVTLLTAELHTAQAQAQEAREALGVAETRVAQTATENQARSEAMAQAEQARVGAEQRAAEIAAQLLLAVERADAAERDRQILREEREQAHRTALEYAQSVERITGDAALARQMLESFQAGLPDQLAVERAAAVAEVEAARVADAAAHREVTEKVVWRLHTVLEDVWMRLGKRECERARTKQATAAKLRAWAESFYTDSQVETVADALRPALRTYAVVRGGDADSLAVAYARRYVTEARHAVIALLDADPTDLGLDLERLLREWEVHRPRRWADAVMEGSCQT